MLKAIIANASKRKAGFSCLFVPISKTRGVKLYRYKKQRDFAFRKQKQAHGRNLAPAVYEQFYLTKALPRPLNKGSKSFGNGYGGRFGYVTEIANTRRVTTQAVKWLKRKMRKYGYRTRDVHSYNSGWIGRRIVCIDFDIYTMLRWERAKLFMRTKA